MKTLELFQIKTEFPNLYKKDDKHLNLYPVFHKFLPTVDRIDGFSIKSLSEFLEYERREKHNLLQSLKISCEKLNWSMGKIYTETLFDNQFSVVEAFDDYDKPITLFHILNKEQDSILLLKDSFRNACLRINEIKEAVERM